MKKITILFIALVALSSNLISQDFKVLSEAFKNSYAYEVKGENAKAIDALKKVYDSNSYETSLRLGWLNYSSGMFTEAVAYYQNAIALMPYSVEARLGLVYPLSALGNWEQVAKQYEKILEFDPANSTANYRLGLILYGKEQYEKALPLFQKVVNYYPFGYDGLLMLAWTNFKLGKTREAKLLFNKVLLYSPDDASALEGLALIK